MNEAGMPSGEITEAIVRLSEGVPGAVAVLCELVKAMPNSMSAELVLHALELTPLKGSEIWTTYKDTYGGDIGAFGQGVVNAYLAARKTEQDQTKPKGAANDQ